MIEHYDLFWLAPLYGIRLYCCCSNCHWFWYLSTSLSSYIPFFFFWQKFYSFFVCPYFCNLLYYCLGLLKCTPSYAVEFKSSTSCFVTVHIFYVNFFFIIVLVLFDSITSCRGSRLLLKAKIALFISVINDGWLLAKNNLSYMLGVAAYGTNMVNIIKLVWPKFLSLKAMAPPKLKFDNTASSPFCGQAAVD